MMPTTKDPLTAMLEQKIDAALNLSYELSCKNAQLHRVCNALNEAAARVERLSRALLSASAPMLAEDVKRAAEWRALARTMGQEPTQGA
jgi:hypothetical protein